VLRVDGLVVARHGLVLVPHVPVVAPLRVAPRAGVAAAHHVVATVEEEAPAHRSLLRERIDAEREGGNGRLFEGLLGVIRIEPNDGERVARAAKDEGGHLVGR
jgi:hypothetical protein